MSVGLTPDCISGALIAAQPQFSPLQWLSPFPPELHFRFNWPTSKPEGYCAYCTNWGRAQLLFLLLGVLLMKRQRSGVPLSPISPALSHMNKLLISQIHFDMELGSEHSNTLCKNANIKTVMNGSAPSPPF